MDINLTGQQTKVDKMTPYFVGALAELDEMMPILSKLDKAKLKAVYQSEKAPMLNALVKYYKKLDKRLSTLRGENGA